MTRMTWPASCRAGLAALAALAVTTLTPGLAPPAFAQGRPPACELSGALKTEHVRNVPAGGANSSNFSCRESKPDEWHFNITSVDTACPGSIEVLFETAGETTVPLDNPTPPGVCSYTYTGHTGDTVLAASVQIYPNWSTGRDTETGAQCGNGQFVLSHVPCGGYVVTSTVQTLDGEGNRIDLANEQGPIGTHVTLDALPVNVFDHACARDRRTDLPVSSGTMTFHYFYNDECSGDPAGSSGTKLVDPVTGCADSDELALTIELLLANGVNFGYRATYQDDAGRTAVGGCEFWPLEGVRTEIHDAQHQAILTAAKGDTIHDTAVVADPAGIPTDGSAQVVFRLFSGKLCGADGGALLSTDPVTIVSGDVTDPNGTIAFVESGETTIPNDVNGVTVCRRGLSYLAEYQISGERRAIEGNPALCEPLDVTGCIEPLTPGYWKTHLQPSKTSKNGPWVSTYLGGGITLGSGYTVTTLAAATAVWDKMNCGNSGTNAQQNNNALGCLAGHLLAAKLNVANGAAACIGATIGAAEAFLSSIPYTGPSGNYSGISAAQRALAITLKNALDTYNNGNGCPQ